MPPGGLFLPPRWPPWPSRAGPPPGLCAQIPLRQLLGGAQSPGDGQVQYDRKNGHFILLATEDVFDGPPLVYVAVSATDDPCGTWHP